MEQLELDLENVGVWVYGCVLGDVTNRSRHGVACVDEKECDSVQKGEFALEICAKTRPF